MQQLDEVQMIHVGLADRIIAGFDVAIVGREIERRPAALVGEIRIGAVVEQLRGQLVVPVLGRGQQRSPAVVGGLIDIRARRNQILAHSRHPSRAANTSGVRPPPSLARVRRKKVEIFGSGGFLIEARRQPVRPGCLRPADFHRPEPAGAAGAGPPRRLSCQATRTLRGVQSLPEWSGRGSSANS